VRTNRNQLRDGSIAHRNRQSIPGLDRAQIAGELAFQLSHSDVLLVVTLLIFSGLKVNDLSAVSVMRAVIFYAPSSLFNLLPTWAATSAMNVVLSIGLVT
jgi:hypothetical protein